MDQQLIMRPDSETLLKQTEIGQEQGTSLNTLIYLPWYQNECSASVGQFGGCWDSGTQKWTREDQNAGLVILCTQLRARQDSAP